MGKRYCSFVVRPVCMGILFLGMVLSSGCADANRLIPSLKPGQTYAQKVTFMSDMRMMIPYADYQNCEMLLQYKVDDVDAEGVATVTVTIDRLKASMRSLSIICKYDSEITEVPKKTVTPGGKQDRKAQYIRSFTGVKGSKFTAQIDAQGRFLKFVHLDKKIQQCVSGPISAAYFGGNQLALLFSETNLRDYASLWMYGALAGAEPEVNKTWTTYLPIESPQTQPIMGLKNYTLTSVTETDGKKTATFSIATKGPVQKPPLPEYATANIKRRKYEMEIVKVEHGSGEAVLSLDEGRLIKSYDKVITEVQLGGAKNRKLVSQAKNPRKTFYLMEKTIEYISK
jgi:hypothetical protein